MSSLQKLWIVPADLKAVDIICNSLKKIFSQQNMEKESHTLILLLREALNNAVIHGSNLDSTKSVTCLVSIDDSQIEMVVKDEGDGFNWKDQLNACVEPGSTSGRGLCIFKMYADQLNFNEKGNEVRLIKKIAK